MSSVVPPLNAAISSAVKKSLGYHPMLVGAGSTGKKYNMAKFEQLHNGMSYAEVVEVLGADGEVANEDGSSQETPGSYIWTNRNGSSITAVFDENDTLVAAYQDGLDK